jgi:hypothetical protein
MLKRSGDAAGMAPQKDDKMEDDTMMMKEKR